MPHTKSLYVNGQPVNLFRSKSARGWIELTLGHAATPTFALSVPLEWYDAKSSTPITTSGQTLEWREGQPNV